jgi:hypothetical protein
MSKLAIHHLEFRMGENVLTITMTMRGPLIEEAEGEWKLVEEAQAVCDELSTRGFEMVDSQTSIAHV